MEQALQTDLRLARSRDDRQRVITVNSVQTAVVVNLLLESGGLSTLVDALSFKTVLLMGRFTGEQKAFFDVLKEELFNRNYVAVSFDFENPTNRSLAEMLTMLAGMSRFIIADLTNAIVPIELARIVPQLSSVPIVPLIERSEKPFAIFNDLSRLYSWVLEPTVYTGTRDVPQLVAQIVERAESKIREGMRRDNTLAAEVNDSSLRKPKTEGPSSMPHKALNRTRAKKPRAD